MCNSVSVEKHTHRITYLNVISFYFLVLASIILSLLFFHIDFSCACFFHNCSFALTFQSSAFLFCICLLIFLTRCAPSPGADDPSCAARRGRGGAVPV